MEKRNSKLNFFWEKKREIEGGREEGKQKLLFCFLDVFQFLSVAHMKISGADEHTE